MRSVSLTLAAGLVSSALALPLDFKFNIPKSTINSTPLQSRHLPPPNTEFVDAAIALALCDALNGMTEIVQTSRIGEGLNVGMLECDKLPRISQRRFCADPNQDQDQSQDGVFDDNAGSQHAAHGSDNQLTDDGWNDSADQSNSDSDSNSHGEQGQTQNQDQNGDIFDGDSGSQHAANGPQSDGGVDSNSSDQSDVQQGHNSPHHHHTGPLDAGWPSENGSPGPDYGTQHASHSGHDAQHAPHSGLKPEQHEAHSGSEPQHHADHTGPEPQQHAAHSGSQTGNGSSEHGSGAYHSHHHGGHHEDGGNNDNGGSDSGDIGTGGNGGSDGGDASNDDEFSTFQPGGALHAAQTRTRTRTQTHTRSRTTVLTATFTTTLPTSVPTTIIVTPGRPLINVDVGTGATVGGVLDPVLHLGPAVDGIISSATSLTFTSSLPSLPTEILTSLSSISTGSLSPAPTAIPLPLPDVGSPPSVIPNEGLIPGGVLHAGLGNNGTVGDVVAPVGCLVCSLTGGDSTKPDVALPSDTETHVEPLPTKVVHLVPVVPNLSTSTTTTTSTSIPTVPVPAIGQVVKPVSGVTNPLLAVGVDVGAAVKPVTHDVSGGLVHVGGGSPVGDVVPEPLPAGVLHAANPVDPVANVPKPPSELPAVGQVIKPGSVVTNPLLAVGLDVDAAVKPATQDLSGGLVHVGSGNPVGDVVPAPGVVHAVSGGNPTTVIPPVAGAVGHIPGAATNTSGPVQPLTNAAVSIVGSGKSPVPISNEALPLGSVKDTTKPLVNLVGGAAEGKPTVTNPAGQILNAAPSSPNGVTEAVTDATKPAGSLAHVVVDGKVNSLTGSPDKILEPSGVTSQVTNPAGSLANLVVGGATDQKAPITSEAGQLLSSAPSANGVSSQVTNSASPAGSLANMVVGGANDKKTDVTGAAGKVISNPPVPVPVTGPAQPVAPLANTVVGGASDKKPDLTGTAAKVVDTVQKPSDATGKVDEFSKPATGVSHAVVDTASDNKAPIPKNASNVLDNAPATNGVANQVAKASSPAVPLVNAAVDGVGDKKESVTSKASDVLHSPPGPGQVTSKVEDASKPAAAVANGVVDGAGDKKNSVTTSAGDAVQDVNNPIAAAKPSPNNVASTLVGAVSDKKPPVVAAAAPVVAAVPAAANGGTIAPAAALVPGKAPTPKVVDTVADAAQPAPVAHAPETVGHAVAQGGSEAHAIVTPVVEDKKAEAIPVIPVVSPATAPAAHLAEPVNSILNGDKNVEGDAQADAASNFGSKVNPLPFGL